MHGQNHIKLIIMLVLSAVAF